MAHHALNLGKVCIAGRRYSVLPTPPIPQSVATLIGDVEGRIHQEVVRPQVGMAKPQRCLKDEGNLEVTRRTGAGSYPLKRVLVYWYLFNRLHTYVKERNGRETAFIQVRERRIVYQHAPPYKGTPTTLPTRSIGRLGSPLCCLWIGLDGRFKIPF